MAWTLTTLSWEGSSKQSNKDKESNPLGTVKKIMIVFINSISNSISAIANTNRE